MTEHAAHLLVDRAAVAVEPAHGEARAGPAEGLVQIERGALAGGVARAIHQRGLRVGEDLALACFDHPDWIDILGLPVHVVEQPTDEIGRMAVASTHRRHGIGAKVLEALERMALLRGVGELVVHSQLPAEPFYAARAYQREGTVFAEQGVPHLRMRKVLPRG